METLWVLFCFGLQTVVYWVLHRGLSTMRYEWRERNG